MSPENDLNPVDVEMQQLLGSVELEDEGETESEEENTSKEVEAEDTPEVKEEIKPDPLELIKALQTELAEIRAAQKSEETEEEITPPTVLEDQEFISEEEFGNLDAKGMNTLLNKVFKSGAAAAREILLKEGPDVLLPRVARATEKQRVVSDFYKAHPKLADKRKFVKIIGEEIAAENPRMPLTEYFKALAERSYKELGITNKVEAQRPSFAKAGGARKPDRVKMSDAEKDVADLLGDLD